MQSTSAVLLLSKNLDIYFQSPPKKQLIVEFGGEAIRTVPLNWLDWLYCVGIAYLSLPWGFILRMIPVPLETWEEDSDYYKTESGLKYQKI